MERIDPICESGIKPYIGKPVCVVLLDGTTVYGTLNGMNGGQLLVSMGVPGAETASVNDVKTKSKRRNADKNKVKLSAFWGYPGYPYGGVLALELAFIALLFAVPFFWI